MSIYPTKFLLATDGSEDGNLAARATVELSKATGSEVHIVYVIPTVFLDEPSESFHAQAEEHAQTLLSELAERMKSEGAPVAETYLRAGHPDKEIVRLAEELDVGTIVIGSRGLGAINRMLMGSISDSVVRHAHCPVYVLRGNKVREAHS
jgi:nucleotide-binding universal stress UspA family protein